MRQQFSISHIAIPQATIVALFIQLVGLLVAFVPSLAAEKQAIIGIGSTVIAGVFLLANAQHAKAAATLVASGVQKGGGS